jgi:ribosome-binding factor A
MTAVPRDVPRAERVEQLAREVLGEAVHDLKDPRVGFATITSVRMTPDLRLARVWVSVLGEDEERSETMDALRHAAPHLRSVLGQEVRLRYLPQLEFLEDESAIRGARIDEILRAASAGATQPEDESPAATPATVHGADPTATAPATPAEGDLNGSREQRGPNGPTGPAGELP